MTPLQFKISSLAESEKLSRTLADLAESGDIILLNGPLGAGKTCMAQGIGRGCGVAESLISPTFTYIHEYTRAKDDAALYHVDLYRISGLQDAWSLGLDDYLGDPAAITVIEWPEQIKEVLPEERLWISIRPFESNRRILLFSARGERYELLLRAFRKQAFGV